MGIELIVATNLRNGEVAIAQSGASERAISGQLIASDEVIELNSIDPFAHIRVLVSHRERLLPQLVPGLLSFLGANSLIEVRGAAVMETLNREIDIGYLKGLIISIEIYRKNQVAQLWSLSLLQFHSSFRFLSISIVLHP